VLNSFETNYTCRIDAVFIGIFRRYKTVGGQENRAIEGIKFFVLFVPSISVVADKIVILLKGRIVVGRKHFPVCINIHPGPFRLDEQLFEVLQIMATDQDGRVVSNPDIYFGEFWVTVGCGVSLI